MNQIIIWISEALNISVENLSIDPSTHSVHDADLGDVNLDGEINVADIVQLISYILETDNPDYYDMIAADFNADGIINVVDVVTLVNIILG